MAPAQRRGLSLYFRIPALPAVVEHYGVGIKSAPPGSDPVPRQLEASSGQAEAQLAQAFDATGDLIARLKPFAVGTWDLLAEDYALRCAGVEDISSLDRQFGQARYIPQSGS